MLANYRHGNEPNVGKLLEVQRALGYKKTMQGMEMERVPTVHSDTLRRPLRYYWEITDIRCSQDIREVDARWTLWALCRIIMRGLARELVEGSLEAKERIMKIVQRA